MIIGSFACNCVNGPCSTLYQLSDNSIVIDNATFCTERNNAARIHFKKQKVISLNNKNSVDDLKIDIPLVMLLDPRNVFGCPDCLDKGGYYMDFTIAGVTRHFEFDKTPFYFKNLLEETGYKLKQLKQLE